MASASASSWYRCEEETAIRAALNNHDMALRQCRKAADLTGSNAQLNIMLHGGKGRGKRTTLKHALAARMRDKNKGKHDNDEETLCEVDVAQVDCRAYAKNGPRSLLAGVAAAMAGDVDMQMNGAAGTPLALVTAMRLKKQQQHSSSASASTGTMMMTTTTTTMTTMTTTTTTSKATKTKKKKKKKMMMMLVLENAEAMLESGEAWQALPLLLSLGDHARECFEEGLVVVMCSTVGFGAFRNAGGGGAHVNT